MKSKKLKRRKAAKRKDNNEKVKLNKSFSFHLSKGILEKANFHSKLSGDVLDEDSAGLFLSENEHNLLEIHDNKLAMDSVKVETRKEKDGSLLAYVPKEFQDHYIFDYPQVSISVKDDHIIIACGKKSLREDPKPSDDYLNSLEKGLKK
jgi:hypothetical protein